MIYMLLYGGSGTRLLDDFDLRVKELDFGQAKQSWAGRGRWPECQEAIWKLRSAQSADSGLTKDTRIIGAQSADCLCREASWDVCLNCQN